MKIPTKDEYLPQKGERALTVGKTGSGKSAFSLWLMEHLNEAPFVMYDTKGEPKFDTLKNSRVVSTWDGVLNAVDDHTIDYVIFRPSVMETSDPHVMDEYLLRHYNELRHTAAYIDELYQFHKSGRNGPGLAALLTRGRSRGNTVIMSTQRPAWVSGFALSEADKYYIFNLVRKSDRKTLGEIIPGDGVKPFELLDKPEKFGHWFYSHDRDEPTKMSKIAIAKGRDTGYSDSIVSEDTNPSGPDEGRLHQRFPWI